VTQELREWHQGIPIVHIHNLRLSMADLTMSHRFDTAKALERVVLQHVTTQLMSQWYKAVTHGVSVMAVAVSQVWLGSAEQGTALISRIRRPS
jgi:hypothetical protein